MQVSPDTAYPSTLIIFFNFLGILIYLLAVILRLIINVYISFLVWDHKMREIFRKILKLRNFKNLKLKTFKPHNLCVFSDILVL